MPKSVDQGVELKLIELKQKAAEANELQKRRDELIKTFEKLNIPIPLEVRLNYESSIEMDDEVLKEKVRYYTNENRNLKNYLNTCMTITEEGEMLMEENDQLKSDLEMLQRDEKSNLKDYISHVIERLRWVENERNKFVDIVMIKDCKIDIMISKISHLINQLQQPIKELRDKREQGLPLSREEQLFLKLAEISVSNCELKERRDELKELTTELYDQYDAMTDKIVKYLEKFQSIRRDAEPLMLQKKYSTPAASIFEISSTRPPSISTSYSMDIFKTQTLDPLGVAILGLSTVQITKSQQKLESLRKDVLKEKGILE